ncbi:MAG: sulfatase [bacterium]|nr:sulfatase [bacterium]
MAKQEVTRMVSRRDFIKTIGTAAAAAAVGQLGLPRETGAAETAGAGGKRLPNIVFILADDLGWRDTSLYGSTFYRSPHIDALARRGMMFTDAYAASPFCSPTRGSIMTGLWPARTGVTSAVCHVPQDKLDASVKKKGNPAFKAIDTDSATRLKLDYITLAEALKTAGYRTGHFGKWHLGHPPYDPQHQGFDVDVPHTPLAWPPSYMSPWKWPEGVNIDSGKPGEHIEDRMSSEAVKFIRENKDRPFFLNYWAFSVHTPLGAKPELLEKYRGLIDPANPQRDPMMAAMVESFDDAVGTLTKTLDELGLTDDTIIIFTSDNGGLMYAGAENLPATNNAPLRGGKGNLHEGGTREPLVVVWPGVVKGGARSGEVVQSIDYYPTIIDMLGLKPAAEQKFDGISIVPALKGGKLDREAIFCLFPHNAAFVGQLPAAYVRKGDWKLIRYFFDGAKQADGTYAHRYELFDLKWDIGERNNLADEKPELVKKLDALIDGYLKDSGAVLPVPNPDYDPVLGAKVPDVETYQMNKAYAEPLPLPPANIMPPKPKP